MKTHFEAIDLWLITPSLLLIFTSLFLAFREKYRPAMILLFLGALGLRICMAHLDTYLNDWDERYHALVAKNLAHHPLMPTLYDKPVLPYDFTAWTDNHIWLHKQPLSLWQISLSYIIFGVSPFNTRIPSAVMSALMVLLLYGMGKMVVSERVGYIAALLFALSVYALEFVSGSQAVDHIDVAFTFYITASFWAWLSWHTCGKKKYLWLTGLAAGLAVLTKWLPGMLVYSGWALSLLPEIGKRGWWRAWLDMAQAMILSIIVFIPWQVYARLHYPQEWHYEMVYNSTHMSTAVEGHTGTSSFYLDQLPLDYGDAAPYLLIPGLWLLAAKAHDRKTVTFIFSCLLLCYGFFSFIVATKMPAYCYIVCSIVFIALAALADYTYLVFCNYRPGWQKLLLGALLAVVVYSSLHLSRIEKAHRLQEDEVYYKNKHTYTIYCKKVKQTLPTGSVVFGTPGGGEIEMMFFSDATAYSSYPTAEQLADLKKKGFPIAAIDTPELPLYIKNDRDVIILPPVWPG